MTRSSDPIAAALWTLPAPPLSPGLAARTHRRARAHLAPPDPPSLPLVAAWSRLSREAVPALLVSAAVVFAADASMKLTRIGGG